MQYVNIENPEKLYFYNGITMTNDVRLIDGSHISYRIRTRSI